jgi:hypothetical protein
MEAAEAGRFCEDWEDFPERAANPNSSAVAGWPNGVRGDTAIEMPSINDAHPSAILLVEQLTRHNAAEKSECFTLCRRMAAYANVWSQ